MNSSVWRHQAEFCRPGWYQLTVDPDTDTVHSPPQPSLSAWSTSSCGPNVSASDKLNLISKSFPLIPPEWTVNGTSIIYRDLSVRSCGWCSGAALQQLQQLHQLQQLQQRLGACLRHQNWGERTGFDRDGPREEEKGHQTGLIWDTWKTNKHIRNAEVSL